MTESLLPDGAKARFAVVKLWPALKTAEDECIARLKIAAAAIGAECFEVNADGTRLDAPEVRVSYNTVDFVLHLHYDTPKLYDAFSLVALWNPLQFYHEWGYQRTSRNLITHDDFVSCNSRAADDHVARMVRRSGTHLPAKFHLYHSLDQVVHPPSLGEFKLFYAGINWEKVTGGQSRHQEVLKRLDQTDDLRIYGPTIFQGIKVWEGYRSYVREIPFDGISMVHEINKAGLALVLSSQAHKDSELMSNRLFESVASGALVICDENPFARRFFGDALLYIDSRNTVEQIAADIQAHIAWARAEPAAALAKISQAQAIFTESFSLRRNLLDLYHGLEARKQALDELQRGGSTDEMPVTAFFLMPEDDAELLRRHIASFRAQTHTPLKGVLVVDRQISAPMQDDIQHAIASIPGLEMQVQDFNREGLHDASTRRPIGAVIAQLLNGLPSEGAALFVAPNEQLFSNHIRVLANALVRRPEAGCAASAVILQYGKSPIHGIHDIFEFGRYDSGQPNGFARFLFRVEAIPSDIGVALSHLDRKAMAVLIGDRAPLQQIPSSMLINALSEFPSGPWNEAHEDAVIADFSPAAFGRQTGFIACLPHVHTAPSPTQVAPQSLLRRVIWIVRTLLDRRVFVDQLRAVREHGLVARLQVLRRALAGS